MKLVGLKQWTQTVVLVCLAVWVGCDNGGDSGNSEGPSHSKRTMAQQGTGAAGESDVDMVPVAVQLRKTEDGWQLFRDGQPFYVKGAGGTGPLDFLAACGANSNRTWGVDNSTRRYLDQAHRAGLTVAFGIWLEHERHGFDYSNESLVQKQFEMVRDVVREYKDHPAILVWGLGNEMEGYESGTDPRIWDHIEALAKMVKEEDPNHPVMSVVAEIAPGKVAAINERCPSLDIIGINSYGGAPSLPRRYREEGGQKPYIVTEFGPLGPWELPKNSLGVVDEPTSAEKAEFYRQAVEAIGADRELCLGSYAFLWGHKQEATPTWFGLLLPDGKKTNPVDVLIEFWTGKKPDNLCPVIDRLELVGSNVVEAGAELNLQLEAHDPEQAPLHVEWIMRGDAQQYVTGGDKSPTPPSIPGALLAGDLEGAKFVAPGKTGLYRIYAYVDDGVGACVGNIVIQVRGADLTDPGEPAQLPFTVYDEADGPAFYIPSGWMGDTDALHVEPACTDRPHGGKTCIECRFDKANGWGGVVWQHPRDDWGDQPGGKDLTGAKSLTFWVRGAQGGEKVKFGFGLLGQEKTYYDTAKLEKEVRLESEWRQVKFDLTGLDLRRIKTGFFWVTEGSPGGVKFYLDDIRYE